MILSGFAHKIWNENIAAKIIDLFISIDLFQQYIIQSSF